MLQRDVAAASPCLGAGTSKHPLKCFCVRREGCCVHLHSVPGDGGEVLGAGRSERRAAPRQNNPLQGSEFLLRFGHRFVRVGADGVDGKRAAVGARERTRSAPSANFAAACCLALHVSLHRARAGTVLGLAACTLCVSPK